MSAPSATGETPPPERPPAQYEFDRDQNALMGDLGAKMQFVGMLSIVIGAIVLVGSVLTVNVFSLGNLIAGLLYIALGAWTRAAGEEFRDVVRTKGADITHLMDALANIRRIYTLFYWICLVAIALMVISLLFLVLWYSFADEPAVAVTRAIRMQDVLAS